MREIIEKKTVYTFDELSESAKETAREWWRNCENENNSFHETVYEDAEHIANLFGLEFDQKKVPLMGGSFSTQPTIYYSGFSSQGDGACFEGEYRYKKGALKAVKEYAPQDRILHNIVSTLQQLQRRNFYQVACRTKHQGHYYHSGCMDVSCEHMKNSYWMVIDENDFIQSMRDFANWIYSRLQEEYDYVMSDKNVDECIRINEYEFTESGKRA